MAKPVIQRPALADTTNQLPGPMPALILKPVNSTGSKKASAPPSFFTITTAMDGEELPPLLTEDFLEYSATLPDLSASLESDISELREEHIVAMEIYNSRLPEGSKKKDKLTLEKLDLLLALKVTYETWMAAMSNVPAFDDNNTSEEQSTSFMSEVEHLSSIIRELKPSKTIKAPVPRIRKRKAMVCMPDDSDSEANAGLRRSKRKRSGPALIDEEASEAEEEEEEEGSSTRAVGQSHEEKQQVQLTQIWQSLRLLKPFSIVASKQELVSLQPYVKHTMSITGTEITYPQLSIFDRSLLTLTKPMWTRLKIVSKKVDIHPDSPLQLQIPSSRLQLLFSASVLQLTASEMNDIRGLEKNRQDNERLIIEEISQPIIRVDGVSALAYAYAAASRGVVNESKQLIGTIGVLDGVLDAKGMPVQDISSWLHNQLQMSNTSSFKRCHPLSEMNDIAAMRKLSLEDLRNPAHKTALLRWRKAVVEVAANVTKGLALVALFGLGVTQTELWKTLTRKDSASVKLRASDWSFSALLTLAEELLKDSDIKIPPAFYDLAAHSPVTKPMILRFQNRLSVALKSKRVDTRGATSILARAIVKEESKKDQPSVYTVALANPNILLTTNTIASGSPLLTEWNLALAAEKKKRLTLCDLVSKRLEANEG